MGKVRLVYALGPIEQQRITRPVAMEAGVAQRETTANQSRYWWNGKNVRPPDERLKGAFLNRSEGMQFDEGCARAGRSLLDRGTLVRRRS